ncbi:hypothetical protein ES703_10761 [subsurface metagenome]
MISDDTTPEARKVLCELYRKMPVTAKVCHIFEAYRTGQLLSMAGIRLAKPNASEQQIWRIWAKRHLGDELFQQVYGDDDAK